MRRPPALAAFAALAALAAPIALVALLGPGCVREPASDPLERVPALLIDGPALHRVLERAARLTGTPAARRASALLARLGACSEIVGHARLPGGIGADEPAASATTPSRFEALDTLRCRDDETRAERRQEPADEDAFLDRLERARGDHAGFLQWPIGEEGRLTLQLDIDDAGSLRLAGRIDPDEAPGPAGFFLPSTSPPRTALVDPTLALAHLRLRPAAGTGLARLIPAESQGDRLFALKGRLLEGALLEGTLELALLEPAPDREVPLPALVLHHRGAAPTTTALDEALTRLRQTWSIEPTPRSFVTRDGQTLTGGCYADLPLLPELAPCWVVTPDALVLGYRAEAVESILGGRTRKARATGIAPPPVAAAPASAPTHPAAGTPTSSPTSAAAHGPVPGPASMPGAEREERPATRLVVDLARMRAVDRRRAERESADAPAPSPSAAATTAMAAAAVGVGDLYERLELEAVAEDEGIALSGRLRARP